MSFRVGSLYSLRHTTSYCQISRCLESARYEFGMIRSLWHFTGALAAVLQRRQPNFRARWLLQQLISWLKDNTRFCDQRRLSHDDATKWKTFPRYWPFVRGIHRFPVISPHKGQWRGALMFSLICVWINGWVNNGGAGYLRRHCAHYDVTVMPLVKRGPGYCVQHSSNKGRTCISIWEQTTVT